MHSTRKKYPLLFCVLNLFLASSCTKQVCLELGEVGNIKFTDEVEDIANALEKKDLVLFENSTFIMKSFKTNILRTSLGCDKLLANYIIEYKSDIDVLFNIGANILNDKDLMVFDFSTIIEKNDSTAIVDLKEYTSGGYDISLEHFFALNNDSSSSIVLSEIKDNKFNVISIVYFNDNTIILDGYSDYFARFEIDWCYIEEDGKKIYPSIGATKQDIIDGFKNAFALN